MSPKRALHAAIIKERFAHTILKAKHKTLLDNGEKADLIKMQQEKDRLQRIHHEEKARIEAQIRKAETALRRKEEMELKEQRQQEREAARAAMLKCLTRSGLMSRSIAQGSALMRVAATVFTEIPSFKTMRDANIGSQIVRFHHAPVFGLICGLLGMNAEASQRGYLFITMRDVISVATTLNLVGPLGAAVLQHQVSAVAETILKKWADCPVEEACQTAPLLDILQVFHGYLFSRLFCS
ncbi:Urease accessory protein F [Linum perenne]